MRVEVARTASALDALAAPWRSLQDRVPGALPFQSHAWNKAWWESFAQTTPFRQDELFVVSFHQGNDLVGVLPLFMSAYGFGGGTLVNYLRPLGADPNLTEIRSPLVMPDQLDAVLAYWRDFAQNFGLNRCVVQVVAPATKRGQMQPLPEGRRQVAYRYIPNYVVHLGNDWDSFRKGLKRNIKESIRHCYNSLSRDHLACTLVTLSERHAVLEQLPAFFELHRQRAQRQTDARHPDYFANPVHREFIQRLIGCCADAGHPVHLFCLHVDQQCVAMRLGFVINGELYLYYSGYNPDYSKYSVMTTLVVEAMRWALRQGIRRVNLSAGQDVSKTRWAPVEMGFEETLSIPDSVIGRGLSKLLLKIRNARTNPLWTFAMLLGAPVLDMPLLYAD